MRLLLGIILIFLSSISSVYGEEIEDRFGDSSQIVYRVSFNGLPSGTLTWIYGGKTMVKDRQVDILSLDSDTNIAHLLNLQGNEKVFLDSETHLPLKVQRDLVFLGRKELIEEEYDQEAGYVKVVKTTSRVHVDFLFQDPPIHNILSLLYFFPQDTVLEPGGQHTFQLPTQTVNIKVFSSQQLSWGGERVDTYLLKGRGAKRFNLWLDKEDRTPLRLEFFLLLGKVTIVKQD